MEFSRAEQWSGWLFPSPEDLPNPGIKYRSPTVQVASLPAEPPGNVHTAQEIMSPNTLFLGCINILPCLLWASQVALVVMNLHASAGDVKRNGFDPWVGKISWRRTWQPTQYFCLDITMDRGAWWATVHRVAKSQTGLERLSTCAFSSHLNTYQIGN